MTHPVCSTQSSMPTVLQKKQLNIKYDTAQPGGRTPLDGINASNKTLSGYQACQLVNGKQTIVSRTISVCITREINDWDVRFVFHMPVEPTADNISQ